MNFPLDPVCSFHCMLATWYQVNLFPKRSNRKQIFHYVPGYFISPVLVAIKIYPRGNRDLSCQILFLVIALSMTLLSIVFTDFARRTHMPTTLALHPLQRHIPLRRLEMVDSTRLCSHYEPKLLDRIKQQPKRKVS
jgi:hypothetical protein